MRPHSGSFFAGIKGALILFVDTINRKRTNFRSAITEYTTANDIHRGAVPGGVGLIDDPTAKDIFGVPEIQVR